VGRKRLLVLLMLSLALLAACRETSEEGAEEALQPPDHLHGSAWLVTAYEDRDGELVDVLEGTEITANFSQEQAEGGTVYGFTGCNAVIMEQEEDFIRAFIYSRKWQIDELEMLFTKTSLETEDDEVLVTFSYTGEAEEYTREEEKLVVPSDGIEFTYPFEEDEEEWVAGFADVPADYDEDIYELDSEWRELPDDLEGHGVYMQGHNRSDDLFMFLKRQVDGLDPGATYRATFRLVLANSVPAGMSGVGGSPGESVYVKVGATTVEPVIEEDADGWLRVNIDKGNQAREGEDMINIGTLANPNIGPDSAGTYQRMEQDSLGRDFEVTADDDGALWFIVGTDSGFEGLTTLYYDAITVVLEPSD
jgi:hypothetical protein